MPGSLALGSSRDSNGRASRRAGRSPFATEITAAAQRHRIAQLEVLAATLAQVGAAVDVDAALEALLRGATAVVGSVHGLARLFHPATGARTVEMTLDRDGSLAVAWNLGPSPAGTFGARLFGGGGTAVVHDYRAPEYAGYPILPAVLAQGVRSAVHVPLTAVGRCVGMLSLNHERPRYFGSSEVALAEALAAHAGSVVERARAETRRRREEEHFRALIEKSWDAVILTDYDAVIRYASPSVERVLGYAPAEIVDRPAVELIHPDEQARVVAESAARRAQPGAVMITPLRILHKEGSWRWVEASRRNLLDDPHVRAVVINLRDVTERKRVEDDLKELTHKLRVLLDAATSVASTLDLRQPLESLLSRVLAAVRGDSAVIYLFDRDTQRLVPMAWLGHKSGPFRKVRLRIGESFSGAAYRDGRSLFTRNAEETAVYRATVSATNRRLLSSAAAGRLVQTMSVPLASQSGERIGAIMVGAYSAVLSEDDMALLEAVSALVAIGISNRRLFQELERAYADLTRTQQQVIQQERLRALGEMASGVAHDFNNALGLILGFAELGLQDLHDGAASRTAWQRASRSLPAYLTNVKEVTQDAAAVVSRLQDFYRARTAEGEVGPVRLDEVAARAAAITRPRWHDQALAEGRTIAVEVLGEPMPAILGEHAELRQAVTNVIFNAVDALPEGGQIVVETRVDSGRTTTRGQWAVIEVRDTGVGMSEETRQRCLEPFFSTKGARGSGLGLSMVHGVARRHGGRLEITSAPGAGTTVRLAFPLPPAARRSPRGPAALDRRARGANSPPEAPATRLRVLLVDDELLVRQSLAEQLTRAGHRVQAVASGQEALSALDRSTFDVLLTDRAMPVMSGDSLAARVKARDPSLPVVMLTGFGEIMRAAGERPASVDVVLCKPVSRDDLLQALASCRPLPR